MEFLFERSFQFIHYCLYLAVFERVIRVLQDERERIRLLACLEVLAFIDVEQEHILQQFLLRRKGCTSQVSKLNRTIYKQREVTLHFRILRQVSDNRFILLVLFDECVPVKVCIIYLLVDVKDL